MALIRLLLLCLVGWLVYRGLRSLGSGVGPAAPGATARTEDMVPCLACRVNLPKSEAIAVGAQWACCAEHARRGAPPAGP